MGDKPFWQCCLRLAVPIAIQNLLISSFALVDTAMVSQLGGTELSAVGMAGQWVWLFNIFMFGIASGASVFISQYWGAKNEKGIRSVTGIALIVATVFLLPFFLIPLFSPTFVISLFNRDAAIVAVGGQYLSVALWSYPAVMLSGIVSASLRATENVKLPMAVSIVGTLANAVLNYTFIFGIGPIPSMGVVGAALATVISSWLSPVLLILFAYLQKTVLCAPPSAFFRICAAEVRAVLRRMLPVILNEGLWGLGTWIVTLIYANLGKDEYGGVTIFRTCETVAFAFVQGLGAACCVSVGKGIGAGKTEEAVRDAKRYGILLPLFSVLVGGLLIALHAPIIALFNLNGTLPEVTLYTARGMIFIYSLELAVRNIPYIQIVGIFRSGGDTFVAMLFDFGCLWFFAIPVMLILAAMDAPFLLIVLLAFVCEDWPKSALCLWRFKSLKWIKPVTPEGIEGHRLFLEKRKQREK